MTRPPVRRRRGRHQDRSKKVQLPKELREVTIYSVGAKGDGLGKDINGLDYYVPFSCDGDVVKLRITDKRQDSFTGEIVELITQGPEHIAAPCPSYGRCGGCNLQHLSPEAYEHWTKQKVKDILKRNQISTELSPPALIKAGGRRRASFAAMKKSKQIFFGFNTRASHRIEEIENCLLLTDQLNALIPAIRELLPKIMKQEGRGDIIINYPLETADIVFALPGKVDLKIHEALSNFAEKHNIARLSWQENAQGEPETILQRGPVTTRFSDVEVELPPAPFLQPSKQGEERLVEFALSALSGEKKVLDLYAGCGSFTFALAQKAIVHAVESNGAALKALERSAGRADLGGRITTEVRDLSRQPLMGKELAKYDAVLFDPPRAGAREQSVELAKSDIPLIIAISCNPATFARDAQSLIEGGYRLEEVLPVDQFTWSDHVEIAALFRKG